MNPGDVRSALWGDDVARVRTVIAVAFAVACIAYLLVVHAAGIETEVIRDRYWKNAEPLFHGDFPATEYPPLAVLLFGIPRLFADSPWGYETAYVAMMWVFMVSGLVAIDRMAALLDRSRRGAMGAYALLTLLMIEFVLDRFDMIVAVFIIASLLMVVSGRVRLSFLLLAVATLLKVVPAILFPVLVAGLLADGRRRDAAEGAAVYMATGAVVMLAFWIVEPDSVTSFLSYNSSRPLQVESVAAALLYPLSILGVSDMWIQSATEEGSFLSDNLRGPLPDAVAAELLPVMVVAVAAVWAVYAATASRAPSASRTGLLGAGCLAVILAFLVTNKVLSSQYLVWAFGPLLLAVLTSSYGASRRFFGLFVAVVVLTQVNFAYNIGYLGGGPNIGDLGMAILLARAVLLVALLGFCLSRLVHAPRVPKDASADASH